MKFKLKQTEAVVGKPKAEGYMKAFNLDDPTTEIEYEVKQEGDNITVLLPGREVSFTIEDRITTEFFNAIRVDYDGETIGIRKSSSISVKYIIDWYIIPRIIAEYSPQISKTGASTVKKAVTEEEKARKLYESKVVALMLKGHSVDEAKEIVDKETSEATDEQ